MLYSDASLNALKETAEKIPNLTIYGPKSAVIGGTFGEWNDSDDIETTFWKKRNNEDAQNSLLLGDFNILVNYLLEISGRRIEVERDIEKALEEKAENPIGINNGESNEE